MRLAHRRAAHQRSSISRRRGADLRARRAHGGEGRQHLVAAGEVVEAGDGDALRHRDAQAQRARAGALGEVVVAEEDRVDRRASGP
jgi:hypothetical protein